MGEANKTDVLAENLEHIKPGTLYLVSTPIGNLKDMTLRALDVLRQVDIIAAEDTRHSKVLLRRYQIKTPIVSYHEYNKKKVTPSLIKRLEQDQSIALITDAGTPGISDPAFYVVRAVISANYNVEAIPGATAFVPALVISGLPCDRFVFEGFLPTKKGRQKRLAWLAEEPRTIVIYESPRRLERTLKDLFTSFGDRPVVVVRELTKKFEQIERSTLADLNIEQIPKKGEFVIVVAGTDYKY